MNPIDTGAAKRVARRVAGRAMVAAQVHAPVLLGRAIRAVTSGQGKNKKPATVATASGIAAAYAAAGVSGDAVPRDPTRTCGLRAAKVAAGVPGAR